jgi:dipeptidyl aminopeptidase/acylaminoacyl peptidase
MHITSSRRCVLPVLIAALAAAAPAAVAGGKAAPAGGGFTLEQIGSLPFPAELTAAGQRLAWTFNESGRRNVWVAEGPAFTARQLTDSARDDGQELTSVSISPDGEWVVYVRGGDHGTNWDPGPPNPLSLPVPPKVEIWSVPFAGGTPRLLAEGDDPAVSPKGDVVAYLSGGQAWVVPIDGSSPGKRLFVAKGGTRDLQWSPDGSQIAFVSSREDHSFVGVFSGEGQPLRWIAPTTSRDFSPRWSRDGQRLAFVRRPGAGGPPEPVLEQRLEPWALWIADVASGEARLLWSSPETPRGSLPTTHGGVNLRWAAGERLAFLSYVDGWPHLYSIPSSGGEPLLLTPGDFMAEHVGMSPDGSFLVFAGNAGKDPLDVDRRHVVKVPVDRAAAEVLTPGTGLEWSPVVLGDGAVAYLAATAQGPPLPTVRPAGGATPVTLAADRIPADFPTARLVVPKQVVYQAPDGVKVHAQLFEAAGGAARKPAVVFVHGGPPRQMLLGWHYSSYYSNAYALNQYLASRGFVVLSVNFRLGIGYGYDFHRPAEAGARGASEYRDVKAGAEWLRSQPQVDGARIGIWGGSYGGYLTALALARDSGLFATGVDIHGVHDFTAEGARWLGGATWRYEKADFDKAAEVAWSASPVSSIATWRSPVLLIHGDDDRNVRFGQTVDLAQRLRRQGVEFEELVIPDDTHHFLKHANWLRVNHATAEWFEKKLAGPTSR